MTPKADVGSVCLMNASSLTATPGIRQIRAAEAKARLLEAAVKCFAGRSFASVSVGDITSAAGTAHGLLFHHFGDKRGIYLAALEEVGARLREQRTRDLVVPSRGGLRRQIDAHFRAVARRPEQFEAFLSGGEEPDAQHVIELYRWDAIDVYCIHLGLDHNDPAVRIALRGAVGHFDHALLTWLRLDRPFAIERLVDAAINAVSGAVDAIATLDPSIHLRAARTELRACRAAPDRDAPANGPEGVHVGRRLPTR